jgi:protein-disulfide isomerase
MRAAFRLLLGLVALLALPAASTGAPPALWPDDMTLGNAKAKIVVVEYASLSCPHCARFHNSVFPDFRKKYIDSGKVRFVYREFITAPPEVAVSAAILARCSGKDRYFKVVERMFAAQEEIYRDGTMAGLRKVLTREGVAVGMTEPQVTACLSDQAAYEAMDKRVARAVNEEKVEGTPTFVINGVRVASPPGGEMDLATLDKAIKAAK